MKICKKSFALLLRLLHRLAVNAGGALVAHYRQQSTGEVAIVRDPFEKITLGAGLVSSLVLGSLQQVRPLWGYAPPRYRLARPIRGVVWGVVGKRQGQLTRDRSSHTIPPFAPLPFGSFIARMKGSDFSGGCSRVVVASFPTPTSWRLQRSPRVRTFDVPPLPPPLPNRPTAGCWASRLYARSPGRSCLLRGLLAFGAAVRRQLLPHNTSR